MTYENGEGNSTMPENTDTDYDPNDPDFGDLKGTDLVRAKVYYILTQPQDKDGYGVDGNNAKAALKKADLYLTTLMAYQSPEQVAEAIYSEQSYWETSIPGASQLIVFDDNGDMA